MSTSIPSSAIINVLDSSKNSTGLSSFDISPSLGLDHAVSVLYCHIPSGNQQDYTVQPKKNLICYIITGVGQLKKGEKTASVTSSDCFSFAASENTDSFTLMAGQSAVTAIIVSDVSSAQLLATAASPEFPTIVSAENITAWRSKGIDTTKAARLGRVTDMCRQESPPWGLTLERIPPGTHSSNAHAHSLEDEFALIVGGKARYWHQGESPERILVPGDAVGWKAGTGICHTLVNDADDERGAGEDLVFLVWGGNCRDEDKVHYAASNPSWWTDDSRWWDCPILPIGPASSLPRYPRPEERPYPS